MRWSIVNCLLLVALASSEQRQKRDLNYLKNLFTSALFGGRMIPSSPSNIEYNFFRDPRLGNKLKVVTKENHRIRGKPMVVLNKKYYETPQETITDTLPITDNRERVSVILKESDTYDTEYRVKIPFEPKYSYKQLQNNEPIMTYTAHNNPDVAVNAELKVRTALPECIKQRIDEVVWIGANPYTVDPVRAMFPIQPHPSINIKYPDIEHNLKLPKYVQPRKNNMILRLKATEKISGQPISLISEPKTPTYEVHPVINMDQTIGGDETIGLIPPPYIPHIGTTEKFEDKIQDTVVNINKVKFINTPVTIQPIFSSYIYETLNHNSPNPTTVVNVGDQIDYNFKANFNSNFSTPPHLQEDVTNESEPGDSVKESIIDKRKDKDSFVKLNNIGSFQNNPIVVSDKTFSYHQSNIDGSSMSFKAGDDGVSVDVKNSTDFDDRGDIPDSLM